MRIVADESLDGGIVDRLRADGHDVIYIAELLPSIPDIDVLAYSCQENILLITQDKDFGELVFRQALSHSDVLLSRLEGLTAKEKEDRVSHILSFHGADLPDMFTVLTKDSLRIRKPNLLQ